MRQQVCRGPATAGRGNFKVSGHLGHHGRVYQLLGAEPPENEGDQAQRNLIPGSDPQSDQALSKLTNGKGSLAREHLVEYPGKHTLDQEFQARDGHQMVTSNKERKEN